MNKGTIKQVIGTVVDVEFQPNEMPTIYNALEVKTENETVVLEVEQHIGNNWARCLALGSTDGLKRGIDVTDTGQPVIVPVGEPTLGRLFNALGQPLDKLESLSDSEKWPIHRKPPSYDDQSTTIDTLETGIKVMDLIAPFTKGGKIGAYG